MSLTPRPALATLLVVPLLLLALPSDAIEPPAKWEPWFEVGGYLGTDDLSRGETNVFLPLLQESDWLLFLEGKGKFFEDDVQEGSLSFGFRKTREDWGYGLGGWNLGGWMGWDVRHTDEENTFHQFSLGVEALSDRFDVRLNGYVPTTGPKSSPGLARVRLTGPGIVMVGGEEVPLDGFDGEVGVKVLGGSLFDREQALRIYAGGFYFDDDDAIDEVAGPRVRAEYRIHDVVPGFAGTQLAFEFEFTHDDLRDAAYEAGLRLRIPLGSPKAARSELTPLERRMTASIVRDVDVVTNRSDEEPVFDVLTKARLDRVVRVEGGDDLQQEIDDAGPRSLIIVRNGTFTGSYDLLPEQTLLGGDSLVRVRGTDSRTSHGFRAPGMRPTFEWGGGGASVYVEDQTHVAGIDFRGMGAGQFGIDSIGSVGRVAMTSNSFEDFTGSAIHIDSGSHWIFFSRNRVDGTGSFGLDFESGLEHVRVGWNVIENTSNYGINFESNARDVQVAGNHLESIGNRGIEFDSSSHDLRIIGNTFLDIGNWAISFDNSSSGLWAVGNRIEDVANRGINFGTGNSDIHVLQNHITNTVSYGINFAGSNSDIWAIGNHVTGTSSHGVNFDSNNSNVVFKNNVIRDTGANALSFGSNNGGLQVTGNRFQGPIATDGVSFGSNNSGTFSSNAFRGDIADDGIDLNGSGNALVGGNNVNGATFGDLLCEDVGGNDASRILFTGGAHCP